MSFYVRVPGTSANIGPGFDSIGIALSLYNEYEVSELESGEQFINIDPQFANAEHLMIRSIRYVEDAFGLPHKGILLKAVKEEIPVARGLGSSAAMISAGVCLANALHGLMLPSIKLLNLVSEIEGHPDNVSPALFGGLTVSCKTEDGYYTKLLTPDRCFLFAVAIPDFEVPTKEARRLLPVNVPREDAIHNLSRTGLLLGGLTDGDPDCLRRALSDRLHEPYRKKLIPDFDRVSCFMAERGAIGTVISGAGPTLLSVFSNPDRETEEKIRRFKRDEALLNQECEAHWVIRFLPVDMDGTSVVNTDWE